MMGIMTLENYNPSLSAQLNHQMSTLSLKFASQKIDRILEAKKKVQ